MSAAIDGALRDRAKSRALDLLLEDFAAHHPDQPLTDAERAWARNVLGGQGVRDLTRGGRGDVGLG